ncbi:hypothetical protein LTR50_004124 [Elasticomyces elasticus]|nr:hypothetical protein LTR50_004124 [Elasticomyces elasticus]
MSSDDEKGWRKRRLVTDIDESFVEPGPKRVKKRTVKKPAQTRKTARKSAKQGEPLSNNEEFQKPLRLRNATAKESSAAAKKIRRPVTRTKQTEPGAEIRHEPLPPRLSATFSEALAQQEEVATKADPLAATSVDALVTRAPSKPAILCTGPYETHLNLRPRVYNIPTSTIKTKWKPLPEPGQGQIQGLLRTRQHDFLTNFEEEQREQVEKVTSKLIKSFEKRLLKMPLPSAKGRGGGDGTFDESYVRTNVALLRKQLTMQRERNLLLRSQIEEVNAIAS